MKPRDIVVATHGHCFDGMASAALFTKLFDSVSSAGTTKFRYRSCGYGPGMQTIPEAWLDGDDNAILDFRYTSSPRLGWYFDHHVTAFASQEEQDVATTSDRCFYDPGYGSCTKLIADVAREKFALDLDGLDELVRWADIIDAARFGSAEDAIRRDEPVLQLASVIEHHGDTAFLNGIVPDLVTRGVREVAAREDIQRLWQPLAALQNAFVERVKKGATLRGRVVFVDLTDATLDAAAKFVTYALFPSAVYSVTLSRNRQHYKLSVGYNPWSGVRRDHDIASICRRYDGGGHPPVGACSFPLSAVDKARAAAEAVATLLELPGSA